MPLDTGEKHFHDCAFENEDVVYGGELKTPNGESDVKVAAGDGRGLQVEDEDEGD
jgi:hypothetical protein